MIDKTKITAAIALLEANEPDDFLVEKAFAKANNRIPNIYDAQNPYPNYCADLQKVLDEIQDDLVYGIMPVLCDDDTPGKFYHHGYKAAIWRKGEDASQVSETANTDPLFETPHRALMLAILRAMEREA